MNVSVWRKRAQAVATATVRLLRSEFSFYAIVALLVVQAVWFALNARYPMAFDENFHFGLIQLHAGQWQPFFDHQPAGAEAYGPVVRDPSYLYHYLMSFPYRLVSAITTSQPLRIIALRFINIALFTYGLIIARRLLFRLSKSRALVHASLLLFVLVPIVPFLAGQINYDNLFIPLVLWTLLETCSGLEDLRRGRISVTRSVALVSVMMLASLVKYAFLPVAAGVTLFLIWQVCLQRQRWPALLHSLWQDFRRLSVISVISLAVALAGSAGLFIERFGVNMVQYHSLSPDCAQILSIDRCMHYGPWQRDYGYVQAGYKPNAPTYPFQWLYGMWLRSFFAISDTYDTQWPTPLPGGVAILVGSVGLVLLVRYRRLFRDNTCLQLVFVAFLFYTLTLFVQTFVSYQHTGIAAGVNGRYLVAFLPVVFLVVGLAFQHLWPKRPTRKALAFLIVLALFLQGGGLSVWVLRSNQSWYWPNSAIIRISDTLRTVFWYTILH